MPSCIKKNGLLKRNIKRNSNYSTTTFSHSIILLSNLFYPIISLPAHRIKRSIKFLILKSISKTDCFDF